MLPEQTTELCNDLLNALLLLCSKLNSIKPTQKLAKASLDSLDLSILQLNELLNDVQALESGLNKSDEYNKILVHKVIFIEDIVRTMIYTLKYYNSKEQK